MRTPAPSQDIAAGCFADLDCLETAPIRRRRPIAPRSTSRGTTTDPSSSRRLRGGSGHRADSSRDMAGRRRRTSPPVLAPAGLGVILRRAVPAALVLREILVVLG